MLREVAWFFALIMAQVLIVLGLTIVFLVYLGIIP